MTAPAEQPTRPQEGSRVAWAPDPAHVVWDVGGYTYSRFDDLTVLGVSDAG